MANNAGSTRFTLSIKGILCGNTKCLQKHLIAVILVVNKVKVWKSLHKSFKMYALTRSLIRAPALHPNGQMMQAASRQVTMKILPATAPSVTEGYEEKNERLGRQLAPHLTIYKPQLTSMLSITHRGTGIALTGLTWALGLGALMSSTDISHYITMVEGLQMSPVTLTALKFILAFPVGFHTANGVRHLLWDTGRCLKIKEVYSTGYIMLATSIALTALLAAL